ncbi:MAG: NACHT domain-containing protein [Calothrix sp. MO_167.B12]|nr:NACHT domain-containing protein [Calothrix sp. MO_167.B12]
MTPDTSIIFRGLAPLIQPTCNWIGRSIIGEEILERRQLQKTALEPVLQKAAEDVAENIQQFGSAEIDQICLFLVSSEAEAITRQIYATSILESKELNLEEIKEAFLKAFSNYTTIPENELKDSAPKIFNILVEGCEEALQVAIDEGRLAAHEAKSVFRHQVLLDELKTLKKNLEFISTTRSLDISKINKFESDYREQIKVRHGHITPPYIQDIKKIPIKKIYVDSNFLPIPRSSGDLKSREQIDYKELDKQIYRTVLLGNPGGGKSTFAQKLTYDLANCNSERLLLGRKVTPILVVLRDYGAQKKAKECSILEMIESSANANYQVKPPIGALEYMLLNGRAAIIFDGLDELTDTQYRREITNDVECFCNLYPSVPILITSRETGYKEAPLDESKFTVFRIAPFESKQIEEYVDNWFTIAIGESNTDDPKKYIQAFLEESKTVVDLCSNPLMLGLMCNIYRGEKYIPKNRPDVYDKCADMMFEKWDRSRGISIPFIENIQSKIRPLMRYLAYWIYANESLQQGVIQKKLIHQATEYLFEKRFDDRDEAEREANNFIYFASGRAWVFTDVGTTKDGEKLYCFTHRTFLEYFTAEYLNSTHRTPKELFDVLHPRIAKQEWDMVSQIAFQIQDKKSEDAGDELLNYLLTEIKTADKTAESNTKLNLLIFAVQCLEFIVPSPRVTEKIVTLVINECIEFGLTISDNENDNDDSAIILLKTLGKTDKENINKIESTIQNLYTEILQQPNDKEVSLIIELMFILQQYNFLQKSWDFCFNEHRDLMRRIAKQDLLICNLLFYFTPEIYSMSEVVEWYGLENLFLDVMYRIDLNRGHLGILVIIVHDFFSLNNNQLPADKVDKIVNNYSELGNIFLSYPIPLSINIEHVYAPDIISFDDIVFFRDSSYSTNYIPIFWAYSEKNFWHSIQRINNNHDALFGVYLMFAMAYEINMNRESRKYFIDYNLMFQNCRLNQEQTDFIQRWLEGEIDLIAIEEGE